MRRNRIWDYCNGGSRHRRESVSSASRLFHGVSAVHQLAPARTRPLSCLGGQSPEALWDWPLRAAESVCAWPFLAAWVLFYRWSPDPP
jgi:hypothetical protein